MENGRVLDVTAAVEEDDLNMNKTAVITDHNVISAQEYLLLNTFRSTVRG